MQSGSRQLAHRFPAMFGDAATLATKQPVIKSAEPVPGISAVKVPDGDDALNMMIKEAQVLNTIPEGTIELTYDAKPDAGPEIDIVEYAAETKVIMPNACVEESLQSSLKLLAKKIISSTKGKTND